MARVASTMPQPRGLWGGAPWRAVARKTSSISLTVAVGRACSTRAATPAVRGHENDVPFTLVYALAVPGAAAVTATPWAATSGLMRPSAEGPTELKLARAPDEVTAPPARTRRPSAGAPSVLCNVLGPALPAEITTTTPRSAARS